MDTALDTIYNQIKQSIVAEQLNQASIILIATNAMVLVERVPGLTGLERKELVLQVLRKLIGDLVTDPAAAAALLLVVNNVLPTAIDQIVAATNGKLDINKWWVNVKKNLCCCCNSS